MTIGQISNFQYNRNASLQVRVSMADLLSAVCIYDMVRFHQPGGIVRATVVGLGDSDFGEKVFLVDRGAVSGCEMLRDTLLVPVRAWQEAVMTSNEWLRIIPVAIALWPVIPEDLNAVGRTVWESL